MRWILKMPSPPKSQRNSGFLRISVMDRYLTTELVMPFVFGVGAFSGVALAIGSVFDLVRRVTESGLPITTALQVFGLQMPSFIVLAFPMATLLASLTVYSRLSASSEIVALRSCGVSIYRLVVPAVIASFVIMGLTFGFNEAVVPVTNYQAAIALDQALDQTSVSYREKNIFYREFAGSRLSQIFFAHRFDGQRMQDLTVLQYSPQGLSQIVAAASAAWNPLENAWDFFDGTLYAIAPENAYRNVTKFKQQQLQLPRTPLDLALENRKPEQMNIVQAQQFLGLVRQSGDANRIRKLQVQIQTKYALPSICVVFGLVGAALGVRSSPAERRSSPRAAASRGFGISVAIIFSYYMISFVSSSLGEAGMISAFIAAWFPTFLGLGVGGFLLVQAAR